MHKFFQSINKLFNPIFNSFRKINLFSFSIVSLILILINFLPLVNKLGFYLDDWPQLYSWAARGLEGTKQYWIADSRWFTWLIQSITFPLLGTRPIYWHIAMLVLRWITCILFWLVLRKIWPKQTIQTMTAALLFGIYPLFIQQSIAITFSSHWICFTLFLISLLLMVFSYTNKKGFILFTLLGVVFDLFNLLFYEYFLGLEFLRPIIFFILINREESKKSQKFLSIFLHSLPWFIVDFGYLIWRGFLIKVPTLRSPVLFQNIVNSPLKTIIGLFQTVIKDYVQIVFSTWYGTFNPTLFDFKIPSDLFAWVLSLIVFGLFGVFIINLAKKEKNTDTESNSWNIFALCFGAIAVIFGAAPGWASGRSVSDVTGIWNDRFGIASMLGASLFLVGLIFSLIKPTRNKHLLMIIILLALATGANFRNANDFRWSTIYQTRFYNQLVWRAPSIKPDTSILSANELFPKMGIYPTSFAINTLYPSQNPMPQVDYWFFSIPHNFPNNYQDLKNGIEIKFQKWYIVYSSLSTNSIVINWDASKPSCLWVLDSNDRYNPLISEYARATLKASNLSRIINEETSGYPKEEIFGPELGHGWCYYFEKADLAKQNKDWQRAASLYTEAATLGYKTNSGPELTPFIFGFALSGNTEKAIELTDISKTLAEKMKPYLCDQWKAIYQISGSSNVISEAYQHEMSDLTCSE